MSKEPFKRGKAEVLGIYGDAAYAHPPQKSFTCDINQIPSMFFDYKCIDTGQITFGIFIDEVDTRNVGGTGMKNVGDVLPYYFWVPQRVRTPGSHSAVVKWGHAVTDPENIVWDGNTEFTMNFTGIIQN